MDAQVFWDPLGTCSCWHGITTVVMGNCGFTLAPCAKEDRHLVIRNLQRAEDISLEAMEAGIDWKWKTFAEFLDTVDGLPKGINYSGYMGHSALRTYVMGERAFEQTASEDDLRAMEAELRSGLEAGAIGFTTSRSPSHETPDRRPVASRLANWDEVRRLVGVMGDLNAGIFELAGEAVDRDPNNPGLIDYHRRLRELAVETGRPITFGLFSRRDAPDAWRAYVKLLEDTAAQGGRMTAQVHSRGAFRRALVQDPAPLRPAAGMERAPRPAARRAEAAPAGCGLRRKLVAAARESRGPQGHRHRGTPRRLRVDPRHGERARAPQVGGGDRPGAWGGSGRGHDRPWARDGHGGVLPPAHCQREPGDRAGADQEPAHGGDVLRLRRACITVDGRLAPDPPPRPLGARQAGAHSGGGGARA